MDIAGIEGQLSELYESIDVVIEESGRVICNLAVDKLHACKVQSASCMLDDTGLSAAAVKENAFSIN